MADKKQLGSPPDDLEDVLSWLEELALDDTPVAPPPPVVTTPVEEDIGLSWLDQIAGSPVDILDEPPTLSWDETRPIKDVLSPSLPLTAAEESEQASMEAAINWLDELAAQPPAPPPAQPVPTPEPIAPPPPPVQEKVEAPSLAPPPAPSLTPPPAPAPAKKKGGMFGEEDVFSITEEELAQAVATGAKLEGFDMPDDDEAALAWLSGLLEDDGDLFGTTAPSLEAPTPEAPTPEAPTLVLPEPEPEPEPELEQVEEVDLEALMAEALAEEPPAPEPIAPPPPPPPPAPAKKKGGMFGEEDVFSITEEELAQAVATGAKLEGFDMPDDDEAALAWLSGLLEDDGDLFGTTATTLEAPTPEAPTPVLPEPEPEPEPELEQVEEVDLEALMAEALAEEPPAPEPIAPPPPPPAPAPAKKKGGMFGEEDVFSITEEELAQAVATGAKLEGFDMPDDDEAALAWLSGLLEDDGDLFGTTAPTPEAPPAEVPIPALPEPEPEPAFELPATDDPLFGMDLEDMGGLSWLDEIAGEEAEPEPEPVLSSAVADPLDDVAAFDLDGGDGLSWLDEMAGDEADIDDLRVLDVLPALGGADDESELIVADLGDFPDDPEEAMRLLEMLAASQETIELDDEEDEAWAEDEAETDVLGLPRMAEFAVGDADDLAEFGLGDLDGVEEDDVLSWLDAAGEDSADDQDAPLAMVDLGDLPEDPDEAMAILERLSAAQDSTASAELGQPQEDDLFALPDLEDWDEFVEADDTPMQMAPSPAEPVAPPENGNGKEDLTEVQELLTEDVSDSLPDWLSMEPAGGGDFDPLAWLDADFGGGDSGVLGWLAAEEEVTKKGSPKPLLDMDTPPAPTPKPTTPAVSPERRKPTAVPTPQPASKAVSRPVYDPAIFHPARQLLNKGDVDGALKQYEQYMQAGELPILIDELEHVVSSSGRNPLLRRLLGDAYMHNGQMQEALDMYIIARDQL